MYDAEHMNLPPPVHDIHHLNLTQHVPVSVKLRQSKRREIKCKICLFLPGFHYKLLTNYDHIIKRKRCDLLHLLCDYDCYRVF